MNVDGVFRAAILSATHNRAVAAGVRRHGMRLGAGRFVAGETLDEAVAVLRRLNAQGLAANTTLLGEGVRDAATARGVADAYLGIFDRVAAEGLDANVALKLTHLGLDLGEEEARANLERVVEHAAGLGNFVRIDMEESARVEPTLRVYRALRAAGHDNVGVVLQSCLYRSTNDLRDLLPLAPNLRLVKGAYLEPETVAYRRKADVDAHYIALAETALDADGYTAIATHDERIIAHVQSFAARRGLGRECYEFQLLYGIRSDLQRRLAAEGYRVRVATPFGREWYFYLMRRLAERPANALFLVRNLARR